MSDKAQELAHTANEAAEILHQETGAPFVLVILAGEAGTAIVTGAWAPGLDEIRRICLSLIERIDSGRVSVKDLTGGDGTASK